MDWSYKYWETEGWGRRRRYKGIEGYLKLSITILATGDEQYIHDEEEEAAKEDKLEAGMI